MAALLRDYVDSMLKRRVEDSDSLVSNHLPAYNDWTKQTAAELSAGITPVNYAYPPGDVRRYGADMSGAADSSAALKAAVQVVSTDGISYVYVPAGTISIASAQMPITFPSNIIFYGEGKDKSRVEITGTGTANFIQAQNQSNIQVWDMTIRGNNEADISVNSGSNQGQAIVIQQTNAATELSQQFHIEGVRFENFKGWYWLYFTNQSASYRMRNIKVINCEFQSESGNSLDPTSLSIPSNCMAFQGQDDGVIGLLTDVEVRGCWADCQYVKMFAVSWHSTARHDYVDNVVINSGLSGANDDKAGYAFLCYNNSGGAGGDPPDLISWRGNHIVAPRSAGIYMADVNRIQAIDNKITGQTDTVDGTLPKGAIVMNACKQGVVQANYIDQCYGGIVANGNSASDAMYVYDNIIVNTANNGFGIMAENLSFSGKIDRIEIVGNSVKATGTSTRGIYCRFSSTLGCSNLVIKDNPCVSGTFSCIEELNSSTPDVVYVDISGNVIVGNGTSTGIFWNACSDTQTRCSITHNKFTGTWDSAGVGLDVRDSTGMTIKDLEFCDMSGVTTGWAMRTGGTQGRLEGIRWNGVADARRFEASGAEDLGIDTPTWTGVAGDFIQHMNVADTTVGGLNSVKIGWNYTTAWREAHVLR